MKYPLILLALAGCAYAHAPVAHPNPLDPNAPAPAIKHDSPVAGYRPFDDSPPLRPAAGAAVREPAHPLESSGRDAAITPHHHH